ncbi:hypothetical protein L2E82_15551 [Cichorium intybus]|uniref:Uncharacterized protein n=1 Tax=Cichorium intybus TaxID=13427 RepID=A0ACB9F3M5_CICIN|nr:hypothetical protein L2E82_15551 [Cichorium intybus]
MNMKKLVPISDQFPYISFPRTKNPISNNFVFQGFNVNNKTSLVPWPFSFSNFIAGMKNESSEKVLDLKGTQLRNLTIDLKKGSFHGNSKNNIESEGIHFSNLTVVNNGSSEEALDLKGIQLGNFTGGVKNGSFDGNSEKKWISTIPI